eukprot:CAMPEP_0172174126 /NCGR_PEP_ID=MMETSP1050-20130122/13473_1 /TAXON_ID=233186 /ORGANISM="Cryptomonas curvata, Strain CCAP979/52" /LENGTH=375 /DNA_ID=CAMNT_0012846031 /DNA_START=214 /DNA_END=1341 /DNA_ORIENTATION=+
MSSTSSAVVYGTDSFIDEMANYLESCGYNVMKVSQEHGKAVDALVSELQRQNWGFRSDYAHYDGSYGTLPVSDRRQPSPITPQLVVCELVLQTADGHTAMQFVREVRKASPLTFIAIWSSTAAESAAARLACFDFGANMVTQCAASLREVSVQIARHGRQGGKLGCVACKMQGLTEDELWAHYPLFHTNNVNLATRCVLCSKSVSNFAVHLRNDHGPPGRGEMPSESRRAVTLYSFALVVCQRSDGRFLLVQEFSNQGFWLPGGAVDPRESLCSAALRETKEEAGVDVELKGILKMEHSARDGYVRLRLIFYARPRDEAQLPKSVPDYESLGAAWVALEDIGTLRLRGTEPAEWCRYVAEGGVIYPLSILSDRGT